MDDTAIVDLYWERDETAIKESENKYNKYLIKIAYNILADFEDSKESANDTYYKAWNSIPPNKPTNLMTYLGKITRQIAIDIYRKRNRKKRRSSQYALSLSEIEECIPNNSNPEQETDFKLLDGLINSYLHTVSKETASIFLCRYYFMDSINDIAAKHKMSKSNIKVILHRTRLGLKDYLEKGGFSV